MSLPVKYLENQVSHNLKEDILNQDRVIEFNKRIYWLMKQTGNQQKRYYFIVKVIILKYENIRHANQRDFYKIEL